MRPLFNRSRKFKELVNHCINDSQIKYIEIRDKNDDVHSYSKLKTNMLLIDFDSLFEKIPVDETGTIKLYREDGNLLYEIS